MNTAQIKALAVFSVFMIIGFGPISPGCLIGMFIVLKRPDWFAKLIGTMYADLPGAAAPGLTYTEEQIRSARRRFFLCLLTLFILDIAPVPMTPVIAFGVILLRPSWFYRAVCGVYGKALTGL